MKLYYHNSIETFNELDHIDDELEFDNLYHMAITSSVTGGVYYI